MKQVANNLAELIAIIMIMVTIAISTATLSLWMGSEVAAAESGRQTASVAEAGK